MVVVASGMGALDGSTWAHKFGITHGVCDGRNTMLGNIQKADLRARRRAIQLIILTLLIGVAA